MHRVLICDKFEKSGLDILSAAGFQCDYRIGLKGDDLRAAMQSADGCIVRSGTRLTADLLAEPGRLRAIARAGVGVDNIDVPAATRKGIVVMNTPGGNTISAAELTIALLMALMRNLPAADASVKAGKWERSKFLGSQVAGKTIAIIGLGRIGREVARRCIGLDMAVIGYDPFSQADVPFEVVKTVDEALARADFISVHVPLKDETKNLISRDRLAATKKGVRIFNVARGGIIDEQALADALASGHVAGAGIDVFDPEPPGADHPLLTAPNVVLTPHLGANTLEAQDAVAREAAQLIVDFLTRGVIQFAVNADSIDRADLEQFRHFIDLSRRLGLLHAQMCNGDIRNVALTYRGDLAGRATRFLTAAFAAGLLEHRHPAINLVNAEMILRESGIVLTESKRSQGGNFRSLMHADVETDKKTYTAAGTVFGQQWLRLVQLGPHRLDAYLDGVLLILTHRDQPGLIGHIGTVFGGHSVNIGQMTVGRAEAGGEAIAVLNLDSVPPEAALAEVRQHGLISSLSVVKLPGVGEMPTWWGMN